MERKLFYAIDVDGRKINIDSLNDESREIKLFCPFCKNEVIPKMGNQKIWHFAHISLCKIDEDLTLDKFTDKTISIDDIKFETDKFTCGLCKFACDKSNGINFDGRWICNECFKGKDAQTIRKLFVN